MDWKKIIREDPVSAQIRITSLIADGVSPLLKSPKGKTLLHAAAVTNMVDIARFALANGVDINARAYDNQMQRRRPEKFTLYWTALFYAIRDGHFEIVRFLLDNGADTKSSYQGESPAGLAIRRRCEDVFWVLMEYGLHNASDVARWPGPLDKDAKQDLDGFAHGTLPKAACVQLVRHVVCRRVVLNLETFLQKHLQQNNDSVSQQRYCRRCLSGLYHSDFQVKRKWELKEMNIDKWKTIDQAFDYGFNKRCAICRAMLTPARSECPVPIGARGVIQPSRIGHEYYKTRNREEDLLQILQLRDALPYRDHLGSLSSALLPRYWLLRCLKSHLACASEEELQLKGVTLPKRLIALYPTRLVETLPGQRGTYCTLSYRWSSHALILQQSNISKFKKGIKVEKLSTTIQDAFRLAHGLGFRYIWVDALCIIQDCEADWHSQALEMGRIYQNSSLTIAAVDSGGQNEKTGLLRGERSIVQQAWRPEGELDTRGWTLQEVLLSRRTLSYTNSGVYWNCTEWNCSERYPSGVPVASAANSGCSTNSISLRHATITKKLPDLQAWAAASQQSNDYTLWHRIVEEYTRRQLTFRSDRLTALQGIVAFMKQHHQRNDSYYAGVWHCDFPDGLMWTRNGHATDSSTWKTILPVSEPWNSVPTSFPTWSWASAGSAVSFVGNYNDGNFVTANLLDIGSNDLSRGRCTGQLKLEGVCIPVEISGTQLSFLLYRGKVLNEETSNGVNVLGGIPHGYYCPGGWPKSTSDGLIVRNFLANQSSSPCRFYPDSNILPYLGDVIIAKVILFGYCGLCLLPEESTSEKLTDDAIWIPGSDSDLTPISRRKRRRAGFAEYDDISIQIRNDPRRKIWTTFPSTHIAKQDSSEEVIPVYRRIGVCVWGSDLAYLLYKEFGRGEAKEMYRETVTVE